MRTTNLHQPRDMHELRSESAGGQSGPTHSRPPSYTECTRHDGTGQRHGRRGNAGRIAGWLLTGKPLSLRAAMEFHPKPLTASVCWRRTKKSSLRPPFCRCHLPDQRSDSYAKRRTMNLLTVVPAVPFAALSKSRPPHVISLLVVGISRFLAAKGFRTAVS